MANLKKHSKQWFIVNSNIFQIDQFDDFLTLEIADRIILYYDPDLTLSYYDWPDGRRTFILGLIVGTLKNPETIHYHAGRFVAITSGWLSLDATGSMGLFYSIDPTSKPLGIICGSSSALISEISQLKLSGRDLRISGMNWDPAPLSRLPNMKRLFIDQQINLVDGTIEVFPRSVQSTTTNLEKAVSLIVKEALDIAMELKKAQRPIYLSMTGGSDSRFVFSALIKARVDFEAFTLLLDDERSKIDARTAQSLCNIYSIRHESVAPEGNNKEDLEIFLAHSGGCGGDRADKYVLGGYYRNLPDNAIVLHGGCFEIGQRFYESKFKNIRFSNIERAVSGIEKSFFEKLNKSERNALNEWLVYRKENPIVNVDWIDAFYIDQRRAAWGAANRQAEDCFKFDWLIFANSWSIINILLCTSVDNRRNNMIQKLAMEHLLPGITTIEPINPKMNLIAWSRKVIFALLRRLKRIIS